MQDFYIKNFDEQLHQKLRALAFGEQVTLRDLTTAVLRDVCKRGLSRALSQELQIESTRRANELSVKLQARHRSLAKRKKPVAKKRKIKPAATAVPAITPAVEPETLTVGK